MIRPIRLVRRKSVSTLALAALFVLAGCGGRKAVPVDPAAPPPPAEAVVPMDLAGQPVLVLPVQSMRGIAAGQDQVTAELLFALGERDTRTTWIGPDRLRSALKRAPGYAQDPAALPADDYKHHGDPYIIDPLASVVRRYSALMDTRLVLIPRVASYHPDPAGRGGFVRLDAAMVDSRSGRVVWFGAADGDPGPEAGTAAVASAAASLALRMLAEPGR